jgi:hypothetical protein
MGKLYGLCLISTKERINRHLLMKVPILLYLPVFQEMKAVITAPISAPLTVIVCGCEKRGVDFSDCGLS